MSTPHQHQLFDTPNLEAKHLASISVTRPIPGRPGWRRKTTTTWVVLPPGHPEHSHQARPGKATTRYSQLATAVETSIDLPPRI